MLKFPLHIAFATTLLAAVCAIATASQERQPSPIGSSAGRQAAPGPDTECCGPISSGGEQLAHFLDSMNVEHLWLSREKVDWRSGQPRSGHGGTHCSAFAAAVAERLDIYMLRPPQHSQDFLATAQGRWFEGEHANHDGWTAVSTPEQAQTLANRGELVVLVHISSESHVHGHIAVVRPAMKSATALDAEGPQTIQAGLHNFASGTAVQSFQSHPGAWPSQVGMYAHSTIFSAPSAQTGPGPNAQ
jgi:hypothetical protein